MRHPSFSRLPSTLAFVAVIVLASCALPRQGHVRPTRLFQPFVIEEHLPFTAVGPYRVEGQAFLRQQGGGVVTCAGASVLVSPATDFVREVLAYTRADGDLVLHKAANNAFVNLTRTTQCDAQSNFSMSGLPAGRWIVTVVVSWQVAGARQGGTLQREVQVPTQDRVLLTDQDLVGFAR